MNGTKLLIAFDTYYETELAILSDRDEMLWFVIICPELFTTEPQLSNFESAKPKPHSD